MRSIGVQQETYPCLINVINHKSCGHEFLRLAIKKKNTTVEAVTLGGVNYFRIRVLINQQDENNDMNNIINKCVQVQFARQYMAFNLKSLRAMLVPVWVDALHKQWCN